MELQKYIDKNKYNIQLTDNYINYFTDAKNFVFDNYNEEYERIINTKFENITPYFFLQEMTWVIMVSGFNSKIISKIFPNFISVLNPMFSDINNGKFQYWDDYCWTLEKPLLNIFNNKRKINAIISNTIEIVSKGIRYNGWEFYKNDELNAPEKLEKFKMVGPAISKHLARNIGLLNFVKPDIHLKRLAKHWNFETPDILCKEIQKSFNIPLGMIDLILFYSASTFGSK